MRSTCLSIVFRLVPKSVTFNDLKRQNGPSLPNSVVYGAHCLKVVDKTITMDNLRLISLLCLIKKRLQRDRATPTV